MRLKPILSLLLLFIAATGTSSAQNLPAKTTWEGKLMTIRLILKISTDSISKQQIAVFDSPDQGGIGLKVSELKVSNDSVNAYSAAIGGGFRGAFNADKTELSGKWGQAGGAWPLVLKRVADKPAYNRPQTPKAPFPYQEEKVIYYNKDKSIQYGATLTLPPSAKDVPVVILITGSGQQDRDENIFGHKLFWVIADHLSRNGIAVLRVDDRGIDQTTGDARNATSLDFSKDVLVGVDYLKSHKGIDAKKIGLIGHSDGGVIGPLAINQSKDIAFMVSLAGVGVKGEDLMYKQIRDVYNGRSLNKEDVDRTLSLYQMMFKLGRDYPSMETRWKAFGESMPKWMEQQPEAFLVKSGFKGPGAKDNISNLAGELFSPWMVYFLAYDPATTLTKITIPVLALNGDKDIQVNGKLNLAGFNTLLTQAGNKHFKTILLPGLNHLFQHANTGNISEYATIEETISPEVLTIITQWIQGLY